MTKNIQQERERLDAEMSRLNERFQRRRQEAERDHKRHCAIQDALLRLRCLELLNVAGGVVLRCRQPDGSRWAKLNDAAGTLIAVRRTRATVDFGELGKVTVALDNLLPAAERQHQGFFVSLGGSNR